MKKLIIFYIFTCFSISLYSFNIRVAPTGFVENIDRTIAREVYIMNETTEPMRVMVKLEDDPLYEKYSLVENIKIFPKVLSIPPKGKRLVRFRITPDKEMEEGEYKSYLVFQQLANEKTRENLVNEDQSNSKEVKVDIQMLTEMGISIYGIKGERISEVNITEDRLVEDEKQYQINMTGEVTGNYSVLIVGEFTYYDSSGEKLGEQTVSKDIMRNSKKEVSLELDNLPDNTSKIEAVYKSHEGTVLKENIYNI